MNCKFYSVIYHSDWTLTLPLSTAAGIRRGMEKMQRAFEFYPYCATSLNYLANHFFFTGQHFLVEQLTETALAVTNHGPTRAHSYYNLARSYHSKVCKIKLLMSIISLISFAYSFICSCLSVDFHLPFFFV